MSRIIALVGHCGIDGPRLQSELSDNLKDVEVVRCNDQQDLTDLCSRGVDLLLFNRQLVGEFDCSDGVELIQVVKRSSPQVKALLVSDYPDAQEQARRAGALPGFGKSQSVKQYAPTVVAALG
jgi:DNA-binding NarL/FixJ family response regulator